jgi:hypothetical protein
MVYQEDVIKVAHHFAGLDLGEADVLRRGMSGKFRSREEFAKARDTFIAKALEQGRKRSLVEEVWRQVESFAGYAFAKGSLRFLCCRKLSKSLSQSPLALAIHGRLHQQLWWLLSHRILCA